MLKSEMVRLVLGALQGTDKAQAEEYQGGALRVYHNYKNDCSGSAESYAAWAWAAWHAGKYEEATTMAAKSRDAMRFNQYLHLKHGGHLGLPRLETCEDGSPVTVNYYPRR